MLWKASTSRFSSIFSTSMNWPSETPSPRNGREIVLPLVACRKLERADGHVEAKSEANTIVDDLVWELSVDLPPLLKKALRHA